MKFFCFAISFLLFSLFSEILQAKPYAYQAKTLHADVEVYEQPNFGAAIIATLPENKIFDVSKTVQNSFYKVRIKTGVLGYVFDGDLQPLFSDASLPHERPPIKQKNSKDKRQETRISEKAKKRHRSFEMTQYLGLQFQNIQFEEDTMGSRRHEASTFFGVKISGPNLILEGPSPSEMNFIFHTGAPGYYQSVTGKPADGWIFIGDFLLQTYFPQNKNTLLFAGFGPLLRYSKFSVTLTDPGSGKTSDYSLDDIAVGAVFNLGAAVRLNAMALRGDLSYFWEKQAYFGGGLSLQFAF